MRMMIKSKNKADKIKVYKNINKIRSVQSKVNKKII